MTRFCFDRMCTFICHRDTKKAKDAVENIEDQGNRDYFLGELMLIGG